MKKRLGFTLIELSIVIAILSIMIGGIMAVITQDVRRSKMAEVKMKMDAIEEKLFDFAKANSRIPCPADGTQPITSSIFGLEATPSTAGTNYCQGGAIAANWDYTTGGATIAGGVVPIRTLGLPDEYMFDPWGGRFTYVVDTVNGACASTAAAGCSNLSAFVLNTAQSTKGSITVDDVGTPANVRVTNAILVLISHGPNGHGAFQLGGVRKNVGSNNTDELANCVCGTNAAQTASSGIFYQGPNTNTSGTGDLTYTFDDIVRYYVRSDFITSSDQATEPSN